MTKTSKAPGSPPADRPAPSPSGAPGAGSFPVDLDLSGRSCLVVGGGTVAARKAVGLLDAGAQVVVVAPSVHADLVDRPGLVVNRRPYRPGDLDGVVLAFAATDDPAVNRRVADDARTRGVLVSVADGSAPSDFTVPSRIRRGRLLVTFSTSGASPAVASWLRRRYEAEFGPELDTLIGIVGDARTALLRSGAPMPSAQIWHRALDSGMLEMIRSGRLVEAKERLQACLSSPSD